MENLSLTQKLVNIQNELKAPKNLYNSFGKYNYRNAESILEAFKPLGKEYNVALTIEDLIEEHGNKIYIKATATLHDSQSNESLSVSAFAREPNEKKGMDDCQVTGAASSYARKYALNGLFAIDDTKDSDTEEYANENKAREKANSTKVSNSSSENKTTAKTNENAVKSQDYRTLAINYAKEHDCMGDISTKYGATRETTPEQWKAIYNQMIGA